MEKLQYIELGPKESWPKSAYSAEGGKDERGKYGNWYDYLNISRRNEALKGMKQLKEQCLRKGTDIKKIVIEYSGYGDSGDEIYAYVDNDNKYEWGGFPGNEDSCPDLRKTLGDKAERLIDGLTGGKLKKCGGCARRKAMLDKLGALNEQVTKTTRNVN